MNKATLLKIACILVAFCAAAAIAAPAQVLTTLHSFDGSDGSEPYAALVQATDGNFYGTTVYGGACDDGTVFKITPSGTPTTLHSFCSQSGCPDGRYLYDVLVQASDGNFYGATSEGGASTNCEFGCGTIFKITPSGTLTTLHSFDGSDGELPYAGLVQGLPGTFYGTTSEGGSPSDGTVFRLTLARECTVCPNP